MKTLKLQLGEGIKEVPFPFMVASAWRQKVKEPLAEIMSQIEYVRGIKLDTVDDMLPALRQLGPYIIDLPDKIGYLVADASPVLEGVLDEADDEQLMNAFVELLKAAFPFGTMWNYLQTLPKVGETKPTSKN